MRPRHRQKRAVLLFSALLLLLIASLAAPHDASAHAKLLKSSPAAGSRLDAQPADIQLFLSESVDLGFSSIKVLDRARREQPVGPLGRVSGDDTTATVPLTAALTPGTYTVVWRTLSAIDGHLTAGSFAFRIRGPDSGTGTPEPDEPIVPVVGATGDPFEGSGQDPDPLRWVIRAIILGAFALLLGGPIVAVLVVEPTVAERGATGKAVWPAVGKRFGRIGAITAAVLILALVLDLLLQVASITDGGLFDALGRNDIALQVLNSTRYGFTWVLRSVTAVLLMVMMLSIWQWNRRGGTGLWEITVAVASLGMLGQSLGSHAAAIDAGHGGHVLGLPLPIIIDWLHMVMVASWVGGLGYLAFALLPSFGAAGLPPDERRAFLGRSIPRFSKVALTSVILLAATGTYSLVLHSNDLGAIIGSQYGQVLALKVGLFAALVGIGAINLRRLTPRLLGTAKEETPSDGGPVRRLGRNIRLEVALAAVALLCAGGLTLIPPPSGADASDVAQDTTPIPAKTPSAQVSTPLPTPKAVTAGTNVSGYDLVLTTRPSIEGDELTLLINKGLQGSLPLTDVTKVLLRVTPQDVDAGSTSYQATLEGVLDPVRQTWKVTEPILTLDGGYLITAVVQRTESPDLKAAFRLDLSEANGLQASVGQVVDVRLSTDPSPVISGTAMLTIELVDGERNPIDGAKITISPFMPAHAHVDPTAVADPVPGQPGTYTVRVDLEMGGEWLFIFNIEREGLPPVKTDASLEVIDPNATPTPLEP
jgi:putative copper export protein/methionine-rich copper-binding protein CopC